MTKFITKAPKGYQVVLAVWPDGRTPFDRVGAGANTTGYGDTSGSITLNLRLYNNAERTMHGHYGVMGLDNSVRHICPRIYVHTEPSYDAVSIRGHEIHYAESMELERIVALMKAWEKRIQALYLGEKETLAQQIRRTFKGIGIENAIVIKPTANTYDLMPIGSAIADYINPAIEDIMKRFPAKQVA